MKPLFPAAALATLALAACGGDRPAVAARADTTSHTEVSRPAPPPARSPAAMTAGDTIHADLAGYGPVHFGMKPAEAATALGVPAPGVIAGEGCTVWRPADSPAGLSFMIENGLLVRLDVDSGHVATDSGLSVGSPVARIRTVYGARATETPHKYRWDQGWKVFTIFSPDSQRALVFEADSHAVRRFHAGLAQQAQYVERCS